MDGIAERTRTTKRMIYYYFESKAAAVNVAVLERAYARSARPSSRSTSTGLDPAAAIRRLAELTFDHHEANPDFIRLVSIENIHRGERIAGSRRLAAHNRPGHRE